MKFGKHCRQDFGSWFESLTDKTGRAELSKVLNKGKGCRASLHTPIQSQDCENNLNLQVAPQAGVPGGLGSTSNVVERGSIWRDTPLSPNGYPFFLEILPGLKN